MTIATCPNCKRTYTKVGLRLHTGSQRCQNFAREEPQKEAARELRKKLLRDGKRTIMTVTAVAIRRRKLEELCGLTHEPTAFYSGAMYYEEGYTIYEWWADKWVADLWNYHKKHGEGGQAFYKEIEGLDNVDEDERDNKLALILLKVLNNG